jgi:uncharacterized membrane protein
MGLSIGVTGLATVLRQTAVTVFGLVLLVTPLALWIAWTDTVLVVVLAIGAVAGVLCSLLAGDRDAGATDRGEVAGPERAPVVSDRFLAEMTGIGPWIYHNRISADPGFRRKMDRLRLLLQNDPRD